MRVGHGVAVGLVQRRVGLLFAISLALLAVAATRATYLSTVRAPELRKLAASQQVERITQPAHRGTITDRTGTDLAVSADATTVFATPYQIKDAASVATRLAPLLKTTPEELLAKLADRQRGFAYLARKLDPRVANRVRRMKIEGIGFVTEPRRIYPQGALAGQVIGAVGTDNVGLSGLEYAHERYLHGTDGADRVVKDALGKPISLATVKAERPGGSLQLSLDALIQERVETVLADLGRSNQPLGATAIVLDPRTSEILAMANWPPVNANRPGRASPAARTNRATTASYEPGSTFKPITVSGALSERAVTPSTTFAVGDQIQVADRVIHNAGPGESGTLNVGQILSVSSNVGAIMVGMRLGKQRFARWVKRFGFGAPTGVDFPGEATGIVPKVSRYSGSSMGNLPIGQGLAVTPTQMVSAYAAIANGGILRAPRLVMKRDGKPVPPAGGRRVISERIAAQVRKMLVGVVSDAGTGEKAIVAGYQVAGKTGTANKPDGYGGYSQSRYVASFIGFAPARDPRLLTLVMIDEPKGAIYGGQVAAPAFQKIMSFALPYLRIPPG